ncbi:MAG: chemotaxis protein CheW [Proteobacteria bacterium]|nr:chemotaxis protein CheW [Pseudomonadota bacterium]
MTLLRPNQDETQEPTERKGLNEKLEKIRSLENKLTYLKHEFIATTAITTDELTLEDNVTFLLVIVSDRLVAIPVSFVDEVVQMAAVNTLPEEIRGVIGLVDFHRSMLAVIDLSELIGLDKSSLSTEKVMVICQSELLKFALMVDEAHEVVTVPIEDIQVSSEILPGVLKTIGVLRYAEQTTHIIDILSVVLSVELDKVGNILSDENPKGDYSEEESP